jgi:hypothetical protein
MAALDATMLATIPLKIDFIYNSNPSVNCNQNSEDPTFVPAVSRELEMFGGSTRARTWGPLIRCHQETGARPINVCFRG